MPLGFWEEKAWAAIRPVLEANPKAEEPALRRALQEAYPFGPREHWPYKVWCKVVKDALRQRGMLKPKPERAPAGGLFEGME